MHANVEQILAFAQRRDANAAQGTDDLFGGGSGNPAAIDLRPLQAWTPMERLQHEFDAIGFFLSGHPLDAYAERAGQARRRQPTRSSRRRPSAAPRPDASPASSSSARERRSQKGNKFAFAMFSEPTGQFEAVIFSETLAAARDLLEPGTPVLLDGRRRARRRKP